ncbi:MAG: hypothetical protein ACJASO_002828, partial [Cyclobacteriaceae bacterium]
TGPRAQEGRGFYNEFGIEQAVGFASIKDGEWFHKIGVGLLQKNGDVYDFAQAYKIRPAEFEVITGENQIQITCRSAFCDGIAYVLKKLIQLQEDGFDVQYELINRGEQIIETDEYMHNFMAINGEGIGPDYELDFPFEIQPDGFNKTVNDEKVVDIGKRKITFNGHPTQDFFFSNLSGGQQVTASWTLTHEGAKIGLSETCDFKTASINLWGIGYVVSPEIFKHIKLLPQQSTQWSRSYRFFSLD